MVTVFRVFSNFMVSLSGLTQRLHTHTATAYNYTCVNRNVNCMRAIIIVMYYYIYTYLYYVYALYSKRNDALASERSIFSTQKTITKFVSCHDESVCTYIIIFWGLYVWWHKTRNRHTHWTVVYTLPAHAREG